MKYRIKKMINLFLSNKKINIALFAAFFTSCIENAPLDSLSPEGPYARTIDALFWRTFWIAVVIFVIVQGALLLAIFLVIVYLGNLHMWVNDVPFLGNVLSTRAHILRLLAQIGMILYSLYIWKSFK